jgi:hypothetical protein
VGGFFLSAVLLMEPKYDLIAFFRVCKEGTKKVAVLKDPERDARNHFNLQAKVDILDFIADCGLKQLRYLKTALVTYIEGHGLEKVDEYDFTIDGQKGYLAFGFNEKNQKWVIKSFHPQEREVVFSEPENARRLALGAKAGIIKTEITERDL